MCFSFKSRIKIHDQKIELKLCRKSDFEILILLFLNLNLKLLSKASIMPVLYNASFKKPSFGGKSTGELYLEPLCKNTRTTLAKLHRIDAQRDASRMGESFYFLWMSFFFSLKCRI